MDISKKGITLFYAEKGAANIENTTFAARVFNNYSGIPRPHIRISNTLCSFLAFGKAKNAHVGRGSPIRI